MIGVAVGVGVAIGVEDGTAALATRAGVPGDMPDAAAAGLGWAPPAGATAARAGGAGGAGGRGAVASVAVLASAALLPTGRGPDAAAGLGIDAAAGGNSRLRDSIRPVCVTAIAAARPGSTSGGITRRT